MARPAETEMLGLNDIEAGLAAIDELPEYHTIIAQTSEFYCN